MWSVYILYSKKDHKLYVGCAGNFPSRFKKHQSGKVTSTKNRGPLTLIHIEKYEKKADAFNRERFLKSLWGGRFKKKVLKEYLNKQSK